MGLLKLAAGSMSGSDDGRATLAESKTNFTEGIFQIITSELPGSSWRILSYNNKVLRMDPCSDWCVRWHFVGKQFFQFANSWCEVLYRSFLRVGYGLEIGVCSIVCFCFGCPHSAHRGRTAKCRCSRAGKRESGRKVRARVRVRVRVSVSIE